MFSNLYEVEWRWIFLMFRSAFYYTGQFCFLVMEFRSTLLSRKFVLHMHVGSVFYVPDHVRSVHRPST